MLYLLAPFFAATTLLAGCSAETENSSHPQQTGEPVAVEFIVPGVNAMVGEDGTGNVQSRATSALPEGSTVRVFACVAGESLSVAPAAFQTYYVKGSHLVPCTVNAQGVFQAEAPSAKLTLPPGEYDFYAYTPAVESFIDGGGGNYYSVSIPQNMDYASSITTKQAVAFSGSITLNALAHQCARVQLSVQRDPSATGITALKVNSATITGFGSDRFTTYIASPFYATTMTGGDKSATATAFTAAADNLSASGEIFLLPCPSLPVTVGYEVTYTVQGIERTQTFSDNLPTLTLESGKSYTLTANIFKDGGIKLEINDWTDGGTQNNTAGEGTYPYVKDGKYIVSSDQYGASRTLTLHDKWTQTPDHGGNITATDGGISSSVASIFEIEVTNRPTKVNWVSTNGTCNAPWRRPTLKELLLMSSFQNQLSGVDPFTGRYWSSTKANWYQTGAIDIDFPSNTTYDNDFNTGAVVYDRCVRDL